MTLNKQLHVVQTYMYNSGSDPVWHHAYRAILVAALWHPAYRAILVAALCGYGGDSV